LVSKKASNEIKSQCWDEALQALGTAAIFEKRMIVLKRALRLLQGTGIVVPASIGFIALSFGVAHEWFGYLLVLGGLLGLFQLITSIVAISSRWDDAFAYAQESQSSNFQMASDFEEIARKDRITDAFLVQYQILKKANDMRKASDSKQGVSDKEKRFGMRAGLRKYQKRCATCQQVPTSMKPTKCDTCGNF
jgi:mobilome CxxCx(11)CxxC protein